MYLAIDIGGTKTLLAVFNNDGSTLEERKFKTPQEYQDFLHILADNVAELSTKKFSACSVAIPGKVNRGLGVGIAFGNLHWQDIPIKNDLEKMLNNIPVYVENDANLAGLSEALLLKDYNKVLYLTISTGIGGVLVANGRMDPNTLDAEVGHMLLEHNDKLVRWQEFASGKAIVQQFGKRASEIEDPKIWYAIAHNIAIGLIDLIAAYTPDIVVIGGGVGSHFVKFEKPLVEILKIYDNPMLHLPPIVQARRPEEAVIFGCYDYAKQQSQ